MMSKSKYILIILGAVVLLGLFIYPRLNNRQGIYTGNLKCLVPNLPELVHIHPVLKIEVNGQTETIPANLGLKGSCHLPLHTHDDVGTIHVESQVIRDYTLGDFFEVWGQPIEKDGYSLEMTVDGKPSQQLGNLIMKDKQEIVLKYSKK